MAAGGTHTCVAYGNLHECRGGQGDSHAHIHTRTTFEAGCHSQLCMGSMNPAIDTPP